MRLQSHSLHSSLTIYSICIYIYIIIFSHATCSEKAQYRSTMFNKPIFILFQASAPPCLFRFFVCPDGTARPTFCRPSRCFQIPMLYARLCATSSFRCFRSLLLAVQTCSAWKHSSPRDDFLTSLRAWAHLLIKRKSSPRYYIQPM